MGDKSDLKTGNAILAGATVLAWTWMRLAFKCRPLLPNETPDDDSERLGPMTDELFVFIDRLRGAFEPAPIKPIQSIANPTRR